MFIFMPSANLSTLMSYPNSIFTLFNPILKLKSQPGEIRGRGSVERRPFRRGINDAVDRPHASCWLAGPHRSALIRCRDARIVITGGVLAILDQTDPGMVARKEHIENAIASGGLVDALVGSGKATRKQRSSCANFLANA